MQEDHDHCQYLIDQGKSPDFVVAVGASAGGLSEILFIVEGLTSRFQGTLIVANHRPPGAGNQLRKILARKAHVEVEEPADDDCLQKSTIYVGDASDRVEVDGPAFDVETDTTAYSRLRRIDDLFLSVAESAGANAMGIILSGALSDGAEGLKAIHDAGGACFVQNPLTAQYESMPNSALEKVPFAFVGSTAEIVSKLLQISEHRGQK